LFSALKARDGSRHQMAGDPAARCLREVVDAVRGVPFDGPPSEPTPRTYYPELLAENATVREKAIRKQIRYLRDIFQVVALTTIDGLDVLDAGSGFALGLLGVACLGAGRAIGVELVGAQVNWARRCLEFLPARLSRRVHLRSGNATDLPVEDESVDIVLSLEAISHYLDYRPFLAEAWRVLKPGGSLIISDGNNGLNPLIRRRTLALWSLHEQPPGRKRRPGYPFYFVDKRSEIITRAYGELSAREVSAIALNTSGMVREEVLDAARHYVETGVLPAQRHRRTQVTVHPTHEMVMERLFNPFSLAKELRRCGFDTNMRGYWGGASGRTSLRWANRALSAVTPVSIVTARGFRIAAVKPATSRP
jgi:SAM-dependent methyltransferase